METRLSRTVDYYLAPHSPWTYLGHARFVQIARETGTQVNVKPIDLARVFPVSGGLPLAKRPPQRQAYRLVELKRFSQHLGVPLNPQPRHFPVASDDAARLIVETADAKGAGAALRLAGAILAAVWAEERDIADAAVLADLLAAQGLPAALLEASRKPGVQARYDAFTQEAIDLGVFGAPTYVIDGELFWGQDRLDFVERRLRG